MIIGLLIVGVNRSIPTSFSKSGKYRGLLFILENKGLAQLFGFSNSLPYFFKILSFFALYSFSSSCEIGFKLRTLVAFICIDFFNSFYFTIIKKSTYQIME
nr:hypothetical protein [Bacillus subtilis]